MMVDKDTAAIRMNFRWLDDSSLASCRGPKSADDLSDLQTLGIRSLVRLAAESNMVAEQVENANLRDYFEPIVDFEAPLQDQIDRVIAFVMKEISKGNPVAISCGMGYGRSGTLLACYLVRKGHTAQEAIESVRSTTRRYADDTVVGPENERQEQAVADYANRMRL